MNFKKNPGFTLIELIVVVTIIAVLSGVILFTIAQYIDKGKDSNIAGNLAVLIPAGEVFYNGNSNSYSGFCDPSQNSVIKNSMAQMPQNSSGDCTSGLTPGVCCNAQSQAWVACSEEFTDSSKAYCVDSRGMKDEIANSECTNISSATPVQCPDS